MSYDTTGSRLEHLVQEYPPMPLHNLLICCGPGPCPPQCPVAVWAKKYLDQTPFWGLRHD